MRMSLTGGAVREGRGRRAVDARRHRAAGGAAGRRGGGGELLRAAAGRLRARVHHRRPAARRAGARRRQLHADLADLLQRLQDSRSCAAAPSPSRTRPARPASPSSTRRWRSEYWPDGDPLGDRITIGRGLGRAWRSRRARSSASSATCATARSIASRNPIMYVPVGAAAGRAQREPARHHAARLDRPHARRAVTLGRSHSEAAARCERRFAGRAAAHDGRSRGAIDGAVGFQHAAADDLRRLGAAPGGDRHLRADGVFGAAADAGNRRPPRARRRRVARAEHGRSGRA